MKSVKRKESEATKNGNKSRVVYLGLAGTATATSVTLVLTVVTTIIVVRELVIFTALAVTVVAEVEADTLAAATTGATVRLWV